MIGTIETIRYVLIHGRVQGVGFRAWAERGARVRALQGWVRNCRDGSVEAVFAGPADKVGEMTEACRRGPEGARVERIEIHDAPADDLSLRRLNEAFSVLKTRD